MRIRENRPRWRAVRFVLRALAFAVATGAVRTIRCQYPSVSPPAPCEPAGANGNRSHLATTADSRYHPLGVVPFRSSLIAPDTADAEFVAAFSRRIVARLGGLHAIQLWASDPPSDSSAASRIVALGQVDGVRHVLFGWAAPAPQGITLMVRLFETKGGTLTWEHTFTGSLLELLSMEGDIARAVAAHAHDAGATSPHDVLSANPTVSPGAYLLYLRAAADLTDRQRGSAEKAMGEFSSVVDIDSTFVAAWTGLARSAIARLEREGGRSPTANAGILRRGLEASERATRIAPHSADAWVARGAIAELQEPRDFGNALKAYHRAVDLEPWNAEAHRRYGQALIELGAVSQGAEQLHRALQEAPGDPEALVELANMQFFENAYHDACGTLDAALGSDPRDADAYVLRAFVRLHLRNIRDAWTDAENGARLGAWLSGGVAAALADADARDTATAHQTIAALVATMRENIERPTVWESHYLAEGYSALGEDAKVLAILGRARPRGASLWWALHDPGFDRLRDTPAFVELLSESRPAPAATP